MIRIIVCVYRSGLHAAVKWIIIHTAGSGWWYDSVRLQLGKHYFWWLIQTLLPIVWSTTSLCVCPFDRLVPEITDEELET